jgi:hypothetical protein
MIGVCLKWVDQRPEFDEFGVAAAPDARFSGVSAADQAALELALRVRDAWAATSSHEVIALTVGPADADGILREALTAGANRAIRIDLPFGTRSRVTATALAAHLATAALVLCGDYSIDPNLASHKRSVSSTSTSPRCQPSRRSVGSTADVVNVLRSTARPLPLWKAPWPGFGAHHCGRCSVNTMSR